MTQEFHISVTPVGQNDYLVRTEQVATGVPIAEELVSWTVDEWLAAASHLMNDPLKSVLQGDAIARNSVNLVALGQQLYNALFQGTLRDSWMTAQGIAQNRQKVLRLRLGLKDTKLARLPWEVMHAGDRPIATGPYIAFSRYQSGIGGTSPIPTSNMPSPLDDGGIRVLMVMASPTDQVRLDLLKQEAIRLQSELHRNAEGNLHLPEIELTILEQPGREDLTQALEQGRFNILHYSGHSNLGSNGGEIYLVSQRTGLTETLSGDDLAGLLVNNNIQMAVFNSCLGAYTATVDSSGDTGERNLTESLVKRGIRSVLAMSERIPDDVALTLTQLFYRNLSQGYPVDLCVSRVRQGLISAYGSHQMYWALPILYLQSEFTGYLGVGDSFVNETELLDEYDPTLTASPVYSLGTEDTDLSLPIDEMMMPSPLGIVGEQGGLDWLGEEDWGGLVDGIEYDDDPSYAEDSALVSDLFRELDQQGITGEQTSMTAELVNQQSEEDLSDILTSERDLWGNFPPANQQQLTENPGESWDNLQLPPAPEVVTTPSRKAAQKRQQRRKNLTFAGIGAGAIAAMITVGWWWQNQQISQLPDIPTLPNQTQTSALKPENSPANLKTTATNLVTASATEKISRGDIAGGLVVVEELLNRNALSPARTALDLVPKDKLDDPSVNFLKGRLAWQAIQTGDTTYSVDDVRRYWESAVKAKPDDSLYINALGFAYYAEGNINRANDSWFKAVNLALKQQNSSPSATPVSTMAVARPKEALTAYAGLAMGLYKAADSQPGEKREQFVSKAIKIRQKVVSDDPVNFQVKELAKNWLWSEAAIRDWQSLLKVNEGN
ncbi:cell division protein HetF [Calothrix sp. 336/3]|uniref:cell division protein HetF n=1 Tax=Calothrix sp. 336/3 TaxID=1337936 RepID=UPI0004E30380|nr:cell division protein HetF [Calothrix sp. 336/3]AKG20799.1 heterocyst differentiation protein [Calothrix sp. 336/3]